MGEYIKLDGKTVKIGTCENMYYCRWHQLYDWCKAMRAQRDSGGGSPLEYLGNGKQGPFRFRFPFPDEDHLHGAMLNTDNFERGVLVDVSNGPESIYNQFDHGFCHWLPSRIGNSQPNRELAIKTTCPNAAPGEGGTDLNLFLLSQKGKLEIVQQRPFEGALWTVVRCPFCGGLGRLTPENGEFLAKAIEAKQPEIAQRIREGYATDTASLLSNMHKTEKVLA